MKRSAAFWTWLLFFAAAGCTSDATSSCKVTSYKFGDTTHLYKYDGHLLIGYHRYVDSAKGTPAVIEYRYNDQGIVSSEVIKLVNYAYVSTLTYDDAGRLTQVLNPDGFATTYGYNEFGQLTFKENTDGHKSVYAYADTRTHNPSSETRTHQGNPIVMLHYVYDRQPNPFRNMVPDGSTQPDNNVISISQDGVVAGSFTYEYGTLGYWTKKKNLLTEETETRVYHCQ